jgi:hypothetical protein
MDIINARFIVIAFGFLVLTSIFIDWTKPLRALNMVIVGISANLYLPATLAIVQDGGDVWIALKAQELAAASLFGWCFGTIWGAVRMYRDSRAQDARRLAVEARYAKQDAAQWEINGECVHTITINGVCPRCGSTGHVSEAYTVLTDVRRRG